MGATNTLGPPISKLKSNKGHPQAVARSEAEQTKNALSAFITRGSNSNLVYDGDDTPTYSIHHPARCNASKKSGTAGPVVIEPPRLKKAVAVYPLDVLQQTFLLSQDHTCDFHTEFGHNDTEYRLISIGI
jgi:hypothetical protein